MKSKRVVSAVTAIALSAGIIGGLGMALKGFNSADSTTGITNTDTTSYVSVGELWDSGNKSFNSDNLDILYKYLTGNAGASYDNVASLASNTTTATNIRSKTLSSGSGYSAKSSSQDVIVTLGGLKWEVVYLSNNTDGEPTLTLWLSNSTQEAFKSRSRTEGAYYGYYNGGMYSDWSADWQNSTVGSYPSNMYGTSYIRVVTLNNGGAYATSNSALSASVSKSSSNVFAPFTMDEFGLTEYIVTPTKMSWQRDQAAKDVLSGFTSYTLPNEAILPSNPKWYSATYNYSRKTNYTAWQNDYLWLPSLAETGYSDSELGMWGLSVNQRKNYDGSTKSITLSGGVGSSNSNNPNYIYNCSLLRSGPDNTCFSIITLSPTGNDYNYYIVQNSLAVRPALHLNLKKIEDSFTYWFDINTNLDGVGHTVEQNYCSFDVYLDNNRVAEQVSDFNGYFAKGVKYEIKNLTLGKDKIYEGTIWGSLTGTITGQTGIELKLRTATWEDYAASSYAGGIGTETNPYIIKTPEQLGKLAKDSRTSNMLGKYFKLGGNIDLSAHIWSGISQTTQITANTFQGTFDGDMYTIKNIKTSVDFYLPHHGGLFGRTNSNATIKNLIIQGGEIRGKGDSGALVGNGQGSCINVIVDGAKVTSDTDASGGIAGTFRGTFKSNICKNSTITGVLYTGGLVAYCGAEVTDSSAINVTVKAASRGNEILGTEVENGSINSSFGQGSVNGVATKKMYGDSNAWGNWSYHPSLNGGYPIQKTLFHLGGMTGSENVYNYLTETLKFSIA